MIIRHAVRLKVCLQNMQMYIFLKMKIRDF